MNESMNFLLKWWDFPASHVSFQGIKLQHSYRVRSKHVDLVSRRTRWLGETTVEGLSSMAPPFVPSDGDNFSTVTVWVFVKPRHGVFAVGVIFVDGKNGKNQLIKQVNLVCIHIHSHIYIYIHIPYTNT